MSADPRVEVLRQANAAIPLGTADVWSKLLAALDGADAAAGIERVRVVRIQGEPIRDRDGNFMGFTRVDGEAPPEHRTAGPGRAWSYVASEWCSARVPCAACGPTYEPLEREEDS